MRCLSECLIPHPSPIEPKLKLYCSLVEKDERAAKAKFAAMRKDFEQMFGL